MEDYYISVDFIYNTSNGQALIFCDGSVHDLEKVKQEDAKKRGVLLEKGYDVIVWNYKEPIEDFINRFTRVFRKVI
jgi:very-short-patch-repair endonuclease